MENFTTETTPETRQRLLKAAGEVFAERGFRAATVRDICSALRPMSLPSTITSVIRSTYTQQS